MPTIWYESIVKSVIEIAPNVREFVLQLPEESSFSFRAGQFITMDLPVGEKRLQRWRSYSIASAPSQLPSNEISCCISKLEGGIGTTYLFEQIQEGSIIRLKGPDGNFCLPEIEISQTEIIVMVCTGTGVAPFMSMIKERLCFEKNYTKKIHLIFGTRYEKGILYRSELEELATQFPLNFQYDIVLSQEPNWKGNKGRVHQIYQKYYQNASSNVHFYLCGWSSMIDEAVATLLLEMKLDKSQVHYELYG